MPVWLKPHSERESKGYGGDGEVLWNEAREVGRDLQGSTSYGRDFRLLPSSVDSYCVFTIPF